MCSSLLALTKTKIIGTLCVFQKAACNAIPPDGSLFPAKELPHADSLFPGTSRVAVNHMEIVR